MYNEPITYIRPLQEIGLSFHDRLGQISLNMIGRAIEYIILEAVKKSWVGFAAKPTCDRWAGTPYANAASGASAMTSAWKRRIKKSGRR